MTSVVTLGECLIAFVADEAGPLSEAVSFRRFVAGAEANVAVGLARLGRDVAFIGRVGADGFGQAIVRRLLGEGVDTTHLAVDPGAPTALMFRERRILGAAQVVYARSGSAGSRLDADDVERAAAAGIFEGTRWLHLTGITPALSAGARAATETAIRIARTQGATISLDLNLRRRLWSDAEAAPVLAALAGRWTSSSGAPTSWRSSIDRPISRRRPTQLRWPVRRSSSDHPSSWPSSARAAVSPSSGTILTVSSRRRRWR